MSVMLRVQKRNTSLHVRHWDSSNASSIETPSLICEQDGFFFAKNTLNLSLNPLNRSKTAFVPASAFVFKHVQPTREEPWRCTAGSLQPKASQQRQPTEVRIDPKSHADVDLGNTFLRILANHAAKPYASFPRRRCAFWIGVRSTKQHLSSHVSPVSFVVKARRSQSWFFFCGGPLHTENCSGKTPHALFSLSVS